MRPTTVFIMLMLAVSPVHAYIGPGAGAGTLAVVLGVIASIFLALVALVWYPIKRLFKSRGGRRKEAKPAKE